MSHNTHPVETSLTEFDDFYLNTVYTLAKRWKQHVDDEQLEKCSFLAVLDHWAKKQHAARFHSATSPHKYDCGNKIQLAGASETFEQFRINVVSIMFEPHGTRKQKRMWMNDLFLGSQQFLQNHDAMWRHITYLFETWDITNATKQCTRKNS